MSISEFAGLVRSTGSSFLNKPDEIFNDTGLRNYNALSVFSRAKREVQGGSSMKATILLDRTQRARNYSPGEVWNLENPQANPSVMEIPWRFTAIPVTWVEQEMMLQQGASRDQRFQVYLDRMKTKIAEAQTDMITRIELDLVAAATADMESTALTASTPYSVFATVTSTGLAPSGFTTVQQINPTAKPNWRSQTVAWDYTAPFDPTAGLVAGFQRMANKVQFEAPDKFVARKNFTENKLDDMVVMTNREGKELFATAIRNSNDVTRVGPQDPAYPNPTFNGITIKAVEVLDESSRFTAGQPDYLFINGQKLTIACHADKWFKQTQDMYTANQLGTVTFYYDSWWNLANQSRRGHGYLRAATAYAA